MASRMLFPARSTFVLPAGISTAAAAMVEPTAVALNAVRRVAVAGRTVLVLGAGTVGLLAAQCARAEGAAAVLVGDPEADRLAVAAGFGLDAVPLPGGADDLAVVREAAGGTEIDVVLVCAGVPAALALACQSVRPAGSVVVVALFGHSELPFDADGFVVRDLTLHGVLGSPCRWPDAIELISSGAVDPRPLAGSPLPLGRVGEAMASMREGQGTPIKILIDPQEPGGQTVR